MIKGQKGLSLLVVFCLITMLCSIMYSYAQERITLTTYYPSPYGIYKELRADVITVGSSYRNVPFSFPADNGTLLVAGRIGVHTTTPAQEIDVKGTIRTEYLDPGFKEASKEYLRIGEDGGVFVGGLMYNRNDANYGDGDDFTIFSNSRDLVLKADGLDIFAYDDLRLVNSANLTLNTIGSRIGVGIDSPRYALDIVDVSPSDNVVDFVGIGIHDYVNKRYSAVGIKFKAGINNFSDTYWKGAIYYNRTTATGALGNLVFALSDEWDSTSITVDDDDDVKMVLTPWSGGQLGIGTTNPSTKLDVRGTSNTCVRLTYTSTSGTRNCPFGYRIALGSAAAGATIPISGYVICCKACTDVVGGSGVTPGNGICD